jgi:hypothetical protein
VSGDKERTRKKAEEERKRKRESARERQTEPERGTDTDASEQCNTPPEAALLLCIVLHKVFDIFGLSPLSKVRNEVHNKPSVF